MKKSIIITALAVLLALAGGVFFWHTASADMGKPIITVPEGESEDEYDLYVPFTESQMKAIKKRVMKNTARTSKGGKPLDEAEIREIVNYMAAAAKSRFEVRIDHLYVVKDLTTVTNGPLALCFPDYDEEAKTANQPIYIDKAAYDKAKTDASAMIHLMYLITHEIGHGIEPNKTHNPISLTGLVFNMWYDAKLVIPEYMNNEFRSQIHEMAADVFACEIILNEFVPNLDMGELSESDGGFGIGPDALYGSQLQDRGKRLLMAVLPGMAEVFNTTPYNDVPMVSAVTDAYASGEITPNEAVAPYAVASFGEFVKYMDDTYGIGEIKEGFAEETLNGYKTEDLKRFTLCAPLLLGLEHVPYGNRYLQELAEEYQNVEKLKDFDRIWIPDSEAERSHKEFAEIIGGYLKTKETP